jgi:hypothetical protein
MQISLNSLLNVGSDTPERLTSKDEALQSSGASKVQAQSKKYKTTLGELLARNKRKIPKIEKGEGACQRQATKLIVTRT